MNLSSVIAFTRILVGIKKNMTDERKITLYMARHLSGELNAPYFEVSALTGENFKSSFRKLAELIYKKKKMGSFFPN